ncbi:unnamed protein product [Cyprideis torosa]|uniref:Hepatocyte growth factor-regulated tyrosine kinase substrate n=1 Tax=Cyprideis torosa TaxID=163714 RepID=A0A7R8WB97_9CRUS|nr:unnamed protein product [Cyprideis torosa]CAG0887152.1 unnamed protein product [Cyprideis torosa]
MFRTGAFDRTLDRATNHQDLLEADLAAVLETCDQIRQGDANPKYAVNALKKKLFNKNPNVQLFAIQVLEAWMKNCGALIHEEVAVAGFMEELRELVNNTANEKVRNKLLEQIQVWAHAFRNEPRFRAVKDVMNVLKAEGHTFPQLRESDAMFSADTAPKWLDGECCHRCRAEFTMLRRKHHCRACGQVFCDDCSSNFIPLPKFGIEKEVRVCYTCFEKNKTPSSSGSRKSEGKKSSPKEDTKNGLPAEYVNSPLAKQSQASTAEKKAPSQKTAEEEEEELQLAIALSQSEAEAKENERKNQKYGVLYGTKQKEPVAPAVMESSAPPAEREDEDLENPELAKYLNRSFWEKKEKMKSGSGKGTEQKTKRKERQAAKDSLQTSPPAKDNQKGYAEEVYPNGETVESSIPFGDEEYLEEMDAFLTSLRSQTEIFVNRMNSDSARGRPIANDSAVQSLFVNLTTMHETLNRYIDDMDNKRVYFEGLQDKCSQIRDARAALDDLRREHEERKRREQEEQQRMRQMQMQEKLQAMRKKKQEYLEYQGQLALQRMQEQEEMRKADLLRHQQPYPPMGLMGYHSGGAPPHMAYPMPPYGVPPVGPVPPPPHPMHPPTSAGAPPVSHYVGEQHHSVPYAPPETPPHVEPKPQMVYPGSYPHQVMPAPPQGHYGHGMYDMQGMSHALPQSSQPEVHHPVSHGPVSSAPPNESPLISFD